MQKLALSGIALAITLGRGLSVHDCWRLNLCRPRNWFDGQSWLPTHGGSLVRTVAELYRHCMRDLDRGGQSRRRRLWLRFDKWVRWSPCHPRRWRFYHCRVLHTVAVHPGRVTQICWARRVAKHVPANASEATSHGYAERAAPAPARGQGTGDKAAPASWRPLGATHAGVQSCYISRAYRSTGTA